MYYQDTISLVKVDQKLINDFIRKAQRRLLLAKPSLFMEEVEAIKAVLQRQTCNCQVFLEEGDHAVRLGFGNLEALKAFLTITDRIKLVMADSIRLSMVLVDDKALFFTPPALAWEEGISSDKLIHPNGVWLSGEWVDQIFAIYAENRKPDDVIRSLPHNVIPFPVGIMPQGNGPQNIEKVKKAIKDLEENNPVDPMRLRQIQFYRNHFKLVRIEIEGANLRTKSVSLRIFNKFFDGREERLKSSWQIFTPDEVKDFSSLTEIYNRLAKAKSDHNVISAGRFGNLIDLSKKEAFEAEIRKIESSIKGQAETSSDKEPCLKTKLHNALSNSKEELLEYLLIRFKSNERAVKKLYESEPLLKKIAANVANDSEKALAERLSAFIDEKLKFPSYETIVSSFNINLDYYDVSDELLNENEDFKAFLKKDDDLEKKLRSYEEGFLSD
ncbi:MAG: hypothetical protein KKB51_06935 [Candidatus Riflebacteria bacterium]|nr:hypothetical protein [Candidatus Riflebacteria bacterium]